MCSEDGVAIFWDYEIFHLASNFSGYEIIQKIQHVAHEFGAVKLFKAYVELSESAISSSHRAELQSSGVSLIDCPHNGREGAAHGMMLVDMLAHAVDNPAPATIILISGDHCFSYAVSTLRLRRYQVVIISLASVHISLKNQASVFLDWNTDVLGIDLEGLSSRVVPRYEDGRGNNRQCSPNIENRCRSKAGNGNVTNMVDHAHAHNVCGSSRVHLDVTSETIEHSPPPKELASLETSLIDKQQNPATAPSGAAVICSPKSTPVVSTPSGALDLDGLDVVPQAQNDNSNAKAPGIKQKPAGDMLSGSVAPGSVSPPPAFVSSDPSIPPIPTTSSIYSVVHLPAKDGDFKLDQPINSVPPHFKLLVEILELHRSNGLQRPLRSPVAVELSTRDGGLYSRAGAKKFGQYVILAEKAGIVEVGGTGGSAWISLRPEWHGANLTA